MFIELMGDIVEGREVPTDAEALEWLGVNEGGNET